MEAYYSVGIEKRGELARRRRAYEYDVAHDCDNLFSFGITGDDDVYGRLDISISESKIRTIEDMAEYMNNRRFWLGHYPSECRCKDTAEEHGWRYFANDIAKESERTEYFVIDDVNGKAIYADEDGEADKIFCVTYIED